MKRPKLIRITTVPISLDKLLEGQLRFMDETYDVIAVSSDEDGYLEKVAKREQVKFHPIQLTRSITPVADLRSLWQMIRFLKREKPLIVHTHTPKAGTIGMLAAKIAGVPIRLHTVAGLPLMETNGAKRKLLDLVEKITYAGATKVLPNSVGLKNIILHEGFCKENKLEVIGHGSSNGIDTQYFDPDLYDEAFKDKLKAKLGILPTDFVFVFVGRIVKDKGIVELVDAFNQLKKSNAKLLLIGDYEHSLDPLPGQTLELIKNNPHIIEAGWQTDVRPFLSISNVLAFPSYREGFPNVVMQAGAMGLPSIVSDINGCNEIIQDGINGIIIPVKKVGSLQKEMNRLLTDNHLHHQLTQNARKKITENYERGYIWQELKQMYDREIAKLN